MIFEEIERALNSHEGHVPSGLMADSRLTGCGKNSSSDFGLDSEGLAVCGQSGRLGLLLDKDYFPMTNRVAYAPQDFQKMCKQAERDLESRKLLVLIDRVKRQIAEQENPELNAKRPTSAVRAESAGSGVIRLPSRSAPFER